MNHQDKPWDKPKRRIIEKKLNGVWIPTTMDKLIVGDAFRMFEAVGVPVTDTMGKNEWTVVRPPVEMGDGTFGVYTED